MATPSNPPRTKRRSQLADLTNRYRFGPHSGYRMMLASAGVSPQAKWYVRLGAFLPSHLWPWIWNVVKNAFKSRHPVVEYKTFRETGIFPLGSDPSGQSPICIS